MADVGPNTDWSAVLKDVHMVVHTVARTHLRDGNSAESLKACRAVNVDATVNLARQAARQGVKRFIFLSSIKVNGESTTDEPFTVEHLPQPEDSYAISKYEAEQQLMDLAIRTGMEVVIIRPPLVYGPGVKGNFAAMMSWLDKGLPLPLGAIHNRRSLVALDNLVDLIATCLVHPSAANELFLISDNEDISTTELLHRLSKAMKKPARLIPVPSWLISTAAYMIGKRDIARRLCGCLQIDISKTKSLLAWRPPVGLDEGLRRTAAGYYEQ